MPALIAEEAVVIQDAADTFAQDFVAEMNKMESLSSPLVYRAKPGVASVSVSRRSPYWQPVDEQC